MIRGALLLTFLLAAPAVAQEAALELVVSEVGELTVQPGDLLGSAAITALHSGIPVRIRLVTALWRDGFIDAEQGRAEWRATVLYEPLERTYRVQTTDPVANERTVATLDEAVESLRRAFVVPLLPPRPGRYYYLANLEVETLSLSDLEELGRWLRGDLAPAVSGQERVGGALARGLGRLMVRTLGVPARRVRVRTPTFEVGHAEAGGVGDRRLPL